MSVCKITETTLYYRGLPASSGLLDPLMGSVDRRHKCASCMNDSKTCQGHPGHIELSFPVYNVGFIDTVMKTLRTVCFCCARLCATPEDLQPLKDLKGRAKLTAVHNCVRGRKVCLHCSMPRPTYMRTPLGIKVVWPANTDWSSEEEMMSCSATFTARDALSILTHIPKEDVAALGFNGELSHPMHMIMQNLVVPPPCTRPAIYSSEGSRSRGQNDLTVRFLEVIRRSQEVASYLEHHWSVVEKVSDELMERVNRLQYEVFMLINNNVRVQRPPGMGRASGSVNSKSLSDRLKGKEGRVRGNLMGKRVDYSARCVITPDAYFDCDRVGVPYRIAKNLTIPETVNTMNIRLLSDRVRRGSNDVHGALTVIGLDGIVTNLETCQNLSAIALRPGDVVERFLSDNDVVVFNRQPSLHMHSMCAHRVRLMPGHTFRVSLPAASPYNADFDGDEMNLHVPQSKAAEAECAALLAIGQNSIAAQNNKPVMGIVQDSLLGLHLLSAATTLVERHHMCRMLGHARHFDKNAPLIPPALIVVCGKKRTRLWTGKQIFSCMLPPSLFIDSDSIDRNVLLPDSELPVVIRSGQLLCGVLSKSHMGTTAGGIIDVVIRDCGSVPCMRLMGDAQRVTHAFLLQRGHHVGIDDVMLSADGQREVNERLAKATMLCEEIQREVVGAPEEVIACAEAAILKLLSKMLLQAGGIVNEHMKPHNAIRKMVTAGSKGSFINLSQIAACLGQQSLEGARIVSETGGRTIPCFARDDVSLASRGMVFNSFALGLSPSELFYHAIGGREGLVDTAVKTSATGYISRRMNKSMEDLSVHDDGVIRNAAGDVVSFVWGSDGFHPAELERVDMASVLRGEPFGNRMTPEEARVASECRRAVLQCKTHVLASEMDTRVVLPFHIQRLQRRIRRDYTDDESRRVNVEAATTRLLEMVATVPKSVGLALMHVCCSSKIRRMDADKHADLMQFVENRVDSAKATHGVSVGCIAAQSIGEPCTQMTLNTFHFAGVSAKNVTMGLPRLKEILDASKNPKTPCTTIRFRKPFASSAAFADFIANTLPLTSLGSIVQECSLVHDPDLHQTTVPEDEWIVKMEQLALHDASLIEPSEHVIRLTLHRETTKLRQLTPPMVRTLLKRRLRGRAFVSSSEVNALDWVVRIRLMHVSSMVRIGNLMATQEAILCHRAANALLETVLIGGHPQVTSAASAEVTRYAADGSESSEHVVHAFGRFLTDAASSSCIDWNRCTTNDLWEVHRVLGIEACAHVLFDQLKSVISFDGTYVCDRHLLMVVDTVCRGGTLMPLNRHGINRTDASPLMRASFEETIDVMCDAAIFAESDANGTGVTASIMMGQLSKVGTGVTHVLVPRTESQHDDTSTTKGVLWSTCRSFPSSQVINEVVEYVMGDVRPAATRPLSPPVSVSQRKRARFRPRSPSPR